MEDLTARGEPSTGQEGADAISRRTFLDRSTRLAAGAVAGLTGLSGILAACGSAAAPAKPSATSTSAPASTSTAKSSTAQHLTLRWSQGQAANTVPGMIAKAMVPKIHQLSNGQLTVHLFQNGSLANDKQGVQEVTSGSLDMAVSSIWTNLVTAGQVLELPYLFTSLTQIRDAMAGQVGDYLKSLAPATGARLLGWWVFGWRDVFGWKPIHKPSDFHGVKVRQQGTKAYVLFYRALGADPVTIANTEVYTALETKEVTLVESSLQFDYSEKFYEQAPYASRDHHGISINAILISNDTWKKLSTSNKDAITTAFKDELGPFDKQQTAYDATVRQKLQAKGEKINSVDIAEFVPYGRKIYPEVVVTSEQKKVMSLLRDMGYGK